MKPLVHNKFSVQICVYLKTHHKRRVCSTEVPVVSYVKGANRDLQLRIHWNQWLSTLPCTASPTREGRGRDVCHPGVARNVCPPEPSPRWREWRLSTRWTSESPVGSGVEGGPFLCYAARVRVFGAGRRRGGRSRLCRRRSDPCVRAQGIKSALLPAFAREQLKDIT